MMPSEWPLKTNEELIIEYKQNPSQQLKQEIVMRYSYIIKAIAMQMRGVYVNFTDIDDIINEGIIVLMSALDKYDISKSVKFESYASLRIRGAIIDIARKQDWIPRTVRKKAKEIEKAISELTNELMEYPTDQQVADHLNLSLEQYQKLVRESCMYNVISLDEMVYNIINKYNPSKSDLPEESLQKTEINQVVAQAISDLRDNEKLVISLYYTKELGMKEIARIMSISEARVSQIHSKALFRLRDKLKDYVQE